MSPTLTTTPGNNYDMLKAPQEKSCFTIQSTRLSGSIRVYDVLGYVDQPRGNPSNPEIFSFLGGKYQSLVGIPNLVEHQAYKGIAPC